MGKNNPLSSISGNKLILPFVLVVVTVLAVFFMIMVSSPAKKAQEKTGSTPVAQTSDPVDLEKVEADYKTKVAEAIKEYSEAADKKTLTAGKIEGIRQQLLGLKVPTKFKDLHISLVMAMVRMENFINGGTDDDKLVSEKAVDEAKKNYAWLN